MPKDTDAPFFNFYPDDFVSDGDVEAMTTEEVGAYMLLLCKAWREKPAATIPNDDRVLARWARLTPEHWSECKAAVMAPWKLCKGGLRFVQPRLKKEYDKMLARRRERHESTTIAANARWEKERSMRHACVTHKPRNANAVRKDAIPIPSSVSSSIPIEEGGSDPPEVFSDAKHAAKAAFDEWSSVERGHPIRDVNNEHRRIFDLVDRMAQEPQRILRGNDGIPAQNIIPQVVEYLRNNSRPFKTIAYAVNAVESEIKTWMREGVPGVTNRPYQETPQQWAQRLAAKGD